MKERKKVIIDTDIGDDIDDALAIFLALRMDYDIIGITTVFLDTEKRARIAKKLLCEYGNGYEKTPVFAGHGEPIDKYTTEITMCQYSEELLCDKYTPDSTSPDIAVDFIIDSCHRYGSELSIIAIGPFTNVARALLKDPSVFDSIGHFIIMGGAYSRQYADWNVTCDVAAADIMFKNVKRIECLGADVTHKLSIGSENYIRLLSLEAEGAERYICECLKRWRAKNGSLIPMLHDPLAVYYLENPDICLMCDAPVKVITEGPARGITLNLDAYSKAKFNPYLHNFDANTKALVAEDVDAKRMVYAFMSAFSL